jgi:hypothetical protein
VIPSLQHRRPGRPPATLVEPRPDASRGLHAYANGLLLIAAGQTAGLLLTALLTNGDRVIPHGLLSLLAVLGGLAVLAVALAGLVLVLAGLVKCARTLNGSRLRPLAFTAAYCSMIAALLVAPGLVATLVYDTSPVGNGLLAFGALFGLVGQCSFLVFLRRRAREFGDESLGRRLTIYLVVWLAGCVAGAALLWATVGRAGGETVPAAAGLVQTVASVVLFLWLSALVKRLRDTIRLAVAYAGPPARRTRRA